LRKQSRWAALAQHRRGELAAACEDGLDYGAGGCLRAPLTLLARRRGQRPVGDPAGKAQETLPETLAGPEGPASARRSIF